MGRMVRVLKVVAAIVTPLSAVDCLSFLCIKDQIETVYDERFSENLSVKQCCHIALINQSAADTPKRPASCAQKHRNGALRRG